ncbi:MAG: aldo/keto reductase [Acidobacteriota bacterium]
MTPERPPNRLAKETSPYLLQHARNPVDWYPWGDEALARAKAEGKPILLSIGYSACHWCHVMERESFEDERVAKLMNDHFVCIKVDREERPDLDEIYMAATVAMNQGRGGWPMTVFLTPDQEPFYAGTYFPPVDRYGMPGFSTLLSRIAARWESDKESMRRQGSRMVEMLSGQASTAAAMPVGDAEIQLAVSQLTQDFDGTYGGFGSAPKFPPSMALSLLLRHHRRTGDAHALQMVERTLDGMAQGGMYDQVAGGFARYSTDDEWLVPHFEKMLYDNALLARVYLEAYQATGAERHARIASEVLDYVLREMTATEGGFFSSTDADSEGEEGKFFVWRPREIRTILGDEDARRFCAYYDITETGNWEGHSIPRVKSPIHDVARRLKLSPEELALSLHRSRALVYDARRKRVPPGLDDKVLTAWNGLMISALAEGHRVLGDRRYLAAAERAASFLLATHRREDEGLLRTSRAGAAHIDGVLEDYAYLAEGLVDLHEAGGKAAWLTDALVVAERMVADFGDDGSFWNTARDHEKLIIRMKEGHDGATPAANAVAAHALARLSFHFDRSDLRDRAVRAISAYGKAIARHPRAFGKSLAVVDLLLDGPTELALVGGARDLEPFRNAIAGTYLPNRIVTHHDPSEGAAPDWPLLAGKPAAPAPALYVCRGFTCEAPIVDPSVVARALERREHARSSSISSAITGRATAGATGGQPRRLGSTGLGASTLGFGCYRIDEDAPEHTAAIEEAVALGCNVIDTSTNYGDGGSERLVGNVLRQVVGSGRIRRDAIVVVSKIGYVQGENLEIAHRREAEAAPFPEMVKYMDGCWHCIHPAWLEDQLRRSLDRLGLETLDVCLLHNPEYFLSDAAKKDRTDLERTRDAFYARVEAAFAFLETQVSTGKIGCYGVSSNTCVAPKESLEATSVSRFVEAARRAGGSGHHFRVLQLPMNLLEPGALLERNAGPGDSQTALDAARDAGLAVLVNRPLNAIRREGGSETMTRLAEHPLPEGTVPLATALADVAALEEEFARAIAPAIQVPSGATPPDRYFRWATELADLGGALTGLEHWREIEGQMLLPQVSHVVRTLDGYLGGETGRLWTDWRKRYLDAFPRMLAAFARLGAERSRGAVAFVTRAIDPLLPAERRGESLSRKALWVLASTPGVTTVLVGMREKEYVRDAMGMKDWPPIPDVRRVYEALAR